jgi:DNA-binding MarR family transcriptional regulator
MPLSAYEVLSEVAAAPGRRIRMGRLAERTMMTPAGLSGIVDRLERDGLVERQPCDGDARGTYAAVTSPGRRRLRQAERIHRDVVRRRYTGRLDDAELTFVGRVWNRLGSDTRPDQSG